MNGDVAAPSEVVPSKTSTVAMSVAASALPSTRVVGLVQVSVAVDIVLLLFTATVRFLTAAGGVRCRF